MPRSCKLRSVEPRAIAGVLGIPRGGFTLTELLVVISIIGVITSALAFTVAGAQERARELRTRSQLTRIQTILQREIYELLETRVPIRVPPTGDFPAGLAPHQRQPEGSISRSRRFWNETRRVDLLYRFPYRAELVRMDAARNIGRPALNGLPTVYYRLNSGAENFQPYHTVPSDLAAIRRLVSVNKATMDAAGLGNSNAKTDSAELLYALLNRLWVDGEPALSLVRESEIADTDDDGFLEIVDVWGSPIYFRLELQMPVNRIAPSPGTGLYNLPLDQYSSWMTQFARDGQTFAPASFDPEVFTPERVKVVLYSSNVTPAFDPDTATEIVFQTN